LTAFSAVAFDSPVLLATASTNSLLFILVNLPHVHVSRGTTVRICE
jgi:hypothetical protein